MYDAKQAGKGRFVVSPQAQWREEDDTSGLALEQARREITDAGLPHDAARNEARSDARSDAKNAADADSIG